jgi:hypothetical protein
LKKYPNEQLLVLSLPCHLIDPLPGFEDDAALWVLSSEVLKAFKPRTFVRVSDDKPWLKSLVLLPPHCIIQSFVLMNSTSTTTTTIPNSGSNNNTNPDRITGGGGDEEDEDGDFVHDYETTTSNDKSETTFFTNQSRDMNLGELELVESNALTKRTISSFTSTTSGGSTVQITVDVLFSIEQLVTEMTSIRQKAQSCDLFPLYHYTSHTSALLISRKGFRVSNGGGGRFQTSDVDSDGNSSGAGGSGGGGVYFTTRGPACYDIGSDGYEKNIIRDFYGVGQLKALVTKSNIFEVVIVYGCCGRVLEKVRHTHTVVCKYLILVSFSFFSSVFGVCLFLFILCVLFLLFPPLI